MSVELADYERILWDLDGTLVRLHVDWRQLKRSLLRYTPRLSAAPDGPLAVSVADIVAESRRLGVQRQVFEKIAAAEIAGMELLEDRIEMLRARQDRSALVTNNTSNTVVHFLAMTRLGRLPFAARDRVERPKPDPEGILSLDWFWRGKRTVLVGDSEFDRQAARSAGIDCLLVSPDGCVLHPAPLTGCNGEGP